MKNQIQSNHKSKQKPNKIKVKKRKPNRITEPMKQKHDTAWEGERERGRKQVEEEPKSTEIGNPKP